MIGFLAVYNGGEGTGFDDYLSDMGEKAISDGVIAKIDAVQANIDATTVPLVDQVASFERSREPDGMHKRLWQSEHSSVEQRLRLRDFSVRPKHICFTTLL